MISASREQDGVDDDFQARLASLPRDCIACDACGKAAPSIACERCATVYYCDASCRKNHAAEHHPDCHDFAAISQRREAQVPSKEALLLSAAGEDAINSECGICFEEQMQQPVTLACRHAFCSTCLVAWQRQKGNLANPYQSMNPDQSHTCPVCRTETEGNVEDDLMLRARLLASRANYLKEDPDAQRDLREKALVVLNKVLEVDIPHIQAYGTKAEVLNELGEYQQLVGTVEELLVINSERQEKAGVLEDMDRRIEDAMMRGDMEGVERIQQQAVAYAEEQGELGTRCGSEDVTEMRILQAEAYIELGEWETAKDIFTTKTPVLSMYGAGTPVQVRRSVMGLARCAYEMKVYDKAIAASEWAIEMNRSFPGVYKYKALAEKAMGDLDAAIVTMNQAVLYETPWDDDNRRKALALYDELLAERQKQQGSRR